METAVLRVLHRIGNVYAIGGIAVPVFGIAVGAGLGVLGETWLIASMARAAVLPQTGRLSMTTGIFGLSWAIVTVLMIIRPGSTTGA